MISERQQEQASLYVVGALPPDEQRAFESELSASAELREWVLGLRRAASLLTLTVPSIAPPSGLKEKVLRSIDQQAAKNARRQAPSKGAINALECLRFLHPDDATGWKPLPVAGAYIKLLSLERERGYAVLMGKLDAGARYPAHTNAGPEDFYVLTGDLVIGDRALRAGDFHHADGGSWHEENYSVEGCTLLAVLTVDDPLVAFAAA